MLPEEYALFGKHVAGASAYVSNFVLWSETGDYFQVSSQTKPLLHLWSLGIEEQFYVVWPALLFIAWKLRLNVFTLAFAGAVASFAFELHEVKSDPTEAFYSPLLRFWELMAGSLLAWLSMYRAAFFKKIAARCAPILQKTFMRDGARLDPLKLCANILSTIGFTLIIVAIFSLNEKHFPGSKALYPVLGTFFVIAAGRNAFFNKFILSNRLMVWIGLISYPLYIWHWPFISFAWIFSSQMPDFKIRLTCVLLAVLMATFTYYFIEPNLRWGRHGRTKAVVLLATMISVGTLGIAIAANDGFPSRTKDPDQPTIDNISAEAAEGIKRCDEVIPDWERLSDSSKGDPLGNNCKLQRNSGKNSIAVIGDSHAGHLYPGMMSIASSNEGVSVFPASCAIPLIGLQSAADPNSVKMWPQRKATAHLISEAFDYILSHGNIRKVVLSHNPSCSWGNVVDLMDPVPSDKDFRAILRKGFSRTYDTLLKAGKEVYVVIDSPSYSPEKWGKCQNSIVRRPSHLPSIFSLAKHEDCIEEAKARPGKEVIDNWRKISHETAAGRNGIHFIDLENRFCPNGICSMLDETGHFMYRDTEHLNLRGSIFAAPYIMNALHQD